MHTNFCIMHSNISLEIVKAGITIEFNKPIFAHRCSNIHSKKESFSYKIFHNIIYLDYYLITNKLGKNTS